MWMMRNRASWLGQGLAREAACLVEPVAVGEGRAGAARIPCGVEVVTGTDRQFVVLAVQVGRAPGFAAEDGDVAGPGQVVRGVETM